MGTMPRACIDEGINCNNYYEDAAGYVSVLRPRRRVARMVVRESMPQQHGSVARARLAELCVNGVRADGHTAAYRLPKRIGMEDPGIGSLRGPSSVRAWLVGSVMSRGGRSEVPSLLSKCCSLCLFVV